ncbi:enoyl-CoA hydratase/isomerase family protein [Marinobacter nanhaiticus D15-8W]|uniref:Enoyl-CoA hydratase/isomerase family protein n=1 Tax=Marinobacter nanhaiticus D15-8W TaxID=626887 RepID=N6WSL9_9GAMM|nr:enoyl-CoA hydratase/isomerase family protein [Marinobacter nanhaiticus]ENO14037.2 enoyl-CoA hydratase/isomerase family protein [Marinobacter nanhaiticus D15-8W]BES71417.1 enoyl-CoA hydratase/isomerase family protein [Marinobacter nanhaiticus D15-8W]
MTWDPAKEWAGYVPTRPFEEYSKQYEDFFKMRRQDGIIELRLHTNDGPYRHTHAAHSAWSRVWQDVGNDPDNHVLIITGTGDKWMIGDPKGLNPKPASDLDPEHTFRRLMDGWKHIENFIYGIDIPTIAAVNGPGVHTEFGILCDVTLAAPDADFMDPHFWLGSPPGDGQAMALQALMGQKRSAYYIYGAKSIPAPKAVEFGIVNDIFPREELLEKAWELARFMMLRPRYTRWATHNILSRHWKKALAQDFGFHMAHQMLANVASKSIVPDPELLKSRDPI